MERAVEQGTGTKAAAWLVFAGAPALAAALGGLATAKGKSWLWWRTLRKPSFEPPEGAFGPVWTVLYGLMGYSAYRVWRRPPSRVRSRALGLWGAQLLLNGLWSPLFFGLRRPRAALVDVLALVPAVGAYAATAARVDRPAGLMMAPYLAWTSFASLLNAAIVKKNPGR